MMFISCMQAANGKQPPIALQTGNIAFFCRAEASNHV